MTSRGDSCCIATKCLIDLQTSRHARSADGSLLPSAADSLLPTVELTCRKENEYKGSQELRCNSLRSDENA